MAPRTFSRGGVICADLRGHGGQQRHSLRLPVGSDPVEIGMALARAIDRLRMAARVGQPELPGLDGGEEGMKLAALVLRYRAAREADAETDGGLAYIDFYCKRIAEALGHLPLRAFAAPDGEEVLLRYRNLIWEKGFANRTCKNLLSMLRAILRWGRSDGRRFAWPLPEDWPRAVRRGQLLGNPVYDTWTEADVRTLREHWPEELARTGRLNRWFPDPGRQADVIARRKLFISWMLYTGAHRIDGAVRGAALNVTFGRYTRHNQKSSATIEDGCFDMPERLRLDCEAELARRGLDAFPEDDLPTGGPWPEANLTLWIAQCRLWPHPDGTGPRGELRSALPRFCWMLTRRTCVREYTIRGWSTSQIADLLGHRDERMIREIYRQCSELHLVSPVRVPWTVSSGPGGRPTERAKVLRFGQ
jgi:integrase